MDNLIRLMERYSYYGRSLVLGGSLFVLLCASLLGELTGNKSPLRPHSSAS